MQNEHRPWPDWSQVKDGAEVTLDDAEIERLANQAASDIEPRDRHNFVTEVLLWPSVLVMIGGIIVGLLLSAGVGFWLGYLAGSIR
jgi:hypothetical protein